MSDQNPSWNTGQQQQSPYGQQFNPYGAQPGGYGPMAGAPGGGLPQEGYPQLANQGARLGARVLDTVFLVIGIAIPVLIAAVIVNATKESPAGIVLMVLFGLVALGLALFYEPYLTWKKGATWGKQICGLKVVRSVDGGPISFGQSMGRYWIQRAMGMVAIAELLDVLWCLWDQPNRQCLHDKVASTVVLKSR